MKTTSSYNSFIKYNDQAKVHELIGCENLTNVDIGGGRTEYIEKQVRITGGSLNHCEEVDKQLFPEKYF